MGLIFVLHVIGIGLLLNRLPIRFSTVFLAFLYFGIFYTATGYYLSSHRQIFTPTMPLEDDWYRNPKKPGVSPFAPVYPSRPKEDEEAVLEQERLQREQRKKEQLNLNSED